MKSITDLNNFFVESGRCVIVRRGSHVGYGGAE